MSISTRNTAAALIAAFACIFWHQTAFSQCANPPPGLISWWRAESNSLDAVGVNHGLIQSNVTYVPGHVGTAFNFNGSNAAVLIGDAPTLQMQNFTIEGWIQRSNTTYASSEHDDGMFFSYGAGGYGFGIRSNGALFATKVGYSAVSAGSVTNLSWHHVAAVSSNGTVIIYVDSVPSTASLSYSPGYYFAYDAAIGARGDNQDCSFLGNIDELSVYSRPLGSNEISAIFNAGTSGKCVPTPNYLPCDTAPSNMVAWWQGESDTFNAISNPGNPEGEVNYATGEVGMGFLLTNINSAISVPDSAELQLVTNFTMECWIQLQSLSQPSLDTNNGDALIFSYGAYGYGWGIHPGGQLFLSQIGIDKVDGPTLMTNGPAHVAVVIYTNYVAFYVDGVSNGYSYSPAFSFKSQPAIGARGDTLAGSLDGIIDELSVYSRPLLSSEISNIYTAGSAGKGDSPPANLVAWWKGENDSFDSAWQQGTPGGALGYGPGEVGTAFDFSTSNSAVVIGNPTALQLQNFTLEAWIKRSSSNSVSWPNSSDGEFLCYGAGGYGWGIHSSGVTYLTQADYTETDGPSITDTGWHHLAVTKSGSTVIFYNNGAPVNTNSYNPIFTFTNNVEIGAIGSLFGGTFNGNIDELAVYSRALTAIEITNIVVQGHAGKCAPQITTPPSSQTVAYTNSVTFSVGATVSAPMTTGYQWFFNGSPITGATASSYSIPSVMPANLGSYTVLVSDPYSSTNSIVATLTMRPSITNEPNSQTVVSGNLCTFNVGAVGTGPLSYQWESNGIAITGATASSYTLNPATSSASFVAVVTNLYGAATSSVATLTVTNLTTTPLSGYYAWWNPETLNTAPGTWTDSSSNGFTLSASGSAEPALTNFNGHKILFFNPGASTPTNVLTASSGFSPNMTNCVLFMVLQPGSYITNHLCGLLGDISAYGWLLDPEYNTDGASQYSLRPGTVYPQSSPDSYEVVTNWQVFAATFNLSNTTLACWTNGTLVYSNATVTCNNHVLSGGVTCGVYYSGFMGDIIIYTNQPNITGLIASNTAILEARYGLPDPPLITTEPVSQAVGLSNSVSFSVGAVGPPPLFYQWMFDGNAISGATGTSYTISSVLASNLGNYSVIVSNSYGAVTSSSATLSSTNSTSLYTPVSGYYAWWNPDTLNAAPGTWTDSSSNAFTLSASGSAEPGLLSFKGHNVLFFNPGASTPTNVLTASSGFSPNMTNCVLFMVLQPGSYITNHLCGLLSDTSAYGWLLDPEYNSDGASQYSLRPGTVYPQSSSGQYEVATNWQVFAATFNASNTTLACWTNGTLIYSNGSATCNNHGLTAGVDCGIYYSGYIGDVIVYTNQPNIAGLIASNTAILQSKYGQGTPPSITSAPTNQTVVYSNSVTFSVGASGSSPLSYQWMFNGSALSGATGSSYTISPAANSNLGSYTVVVTNTSGAVTSSIAVLSMPPFITKSPGGKVPFGNSYTFSVGVAGSAPLSYQWESNGLPISGATASSFTLDPAESYAPFIVVITNLFGAVTSSAAILVYSQPDIPDEDALEWIYFRTNWVTEMGFSSLAHTNVISTNLWLGRGMVLDTTNLTPAYLEYYGEELDATNSASDLNVTFASGAVQMFFAPDWASSNATQHGSGPGSWAYLTGVGDWGAGSPQGFMGLAMDPCGTNLSFYGVSNSVTNVYASAPISWASNQWHFIAASYTPTNSILYIDSGQAASGTNVSFVPGTNALINGGLFIGSGSNGLNQARGTFWAWESWDYAVPGTNLMPPNYWSYFTNEVYGWQHGVPQGNGSPTPSPPPCVTSNNAYLTNFVTTNLGASTLVSFYIEGGGSGTNYDLFASTNIANGTNIAWTWIGSGVNCAMYQFVASSATAFYVVGSGLQAPDGSGLSVTYEYLIGSGTNGDTFLTPTAWYLDHGINPVTTTNVGTQDPNGDGLLNWQEYLYGSNPTQAQGFGIWISAPSGTSGIP